ncbi:ABC transporter permease [Williamsia sterculiae]|uniref:Transport permease protein n=1 Tax=Williamsia sterculiae TaxID=1344003 RepID=A0A1N7DZR6_9NOCA|nr:ABC transporter permease [Williamsia sterculiae]SIR81286.1 ABC-2 type transport system permease protein [Williamsia sterculiae]
MTTSGDTTRMHRPEVADPFASIPMAEVITHIGVRKTLADTATMARRGLLKFKHTPQHLVDVIVVPVVFTVMFAGIFGGAIAGRVGDYLPLLVPGVMVNVTITSTVVVGMQLREDIDRGVFDRFVSLPISRLAPLSGILVASILRYLLAVSITLGVGIVMGYRPHSVPGVTVAVVLVVFSAFALSWLFALLGVLFTKAAAVQGVSALFLTALGFTSNAFVPTQTMPGWMRPVAEVNPISQLVGAARGLANEGVVNVHVGWALLGSVLLIAILAPLTVRTYLRRL